MTGFSIVVNGLTAAKNCCRGQNILTEYGFAGEAAGLCQRFVAISREGIGAKQHFIDSEFRDSGKETA